MLLVALMWAFGALFKSLPLPQTLVRLTDVRQKRPEIINLHTRAWLMWVDASRGREWLLPGGKQNTSPPAVAQLCLDTGCPADHPFKS